MVGAQDDPSRNLPQADARILGQILAAQNIVFALPDTLRIAEFFAQILMTIPGVAACRVCLGGKTVPAGGMAGGVCGACETLRQLAREDDTPAPADSSFKCSLADQPGMRGVAIDSGQHHFGFFVFRIEQTARFEVYRPFIANLAGYVALMLENRWQKAQLERANDELERKVEERTQELTTANEALSAYRGRLEELVRERTAELEAKTAELERMNKLFVGRELRMVELKKKLAELEHRFGKATSPAEGED